MKTKPALTKAILAGASSVIGVRLPLPDDLSEAEFQKRVIAEAEQNGWLHYHVYDSRRCVAGFPDLVMIRDGVQIVAELKVKRNKTTPAQEKLLTAFAAVPGVRVFRWKPADWLDILDTLRGDAVS